MATLPQLARALREALGPAADRAARGCGFTRRRSKLTGGLFVRTLVFGWLANADATLEELSQTAAALGVRISPQGLDGRFTPEAAGLLKRVLEEAARTLISSDPVAVPLLCRFNGVYVKDSTTIALPDALSGSWRGNGGGASGGSESALSLGVRLDLSTGALHGPHLRDGRAHELGSAEHNRLPPRGALSLGDLGYWSLDEFRRLDRADVYWLSAVRADAVVYDAQGERREVADLLRSHAGRELDAHVRLGARHRLPARLIALRLDREVAEARKRELRKQAREKGERLSERQLEMSGWAALVTNAPDDKLTAGEALALGRARWQIELLFKLWKSHGKIDESRSSKPWRVMCEVYAKLLAMLVQHWVLLVSCWEYPDRSLFKAVKTVRAHALGMASGFGGVARLCRVMATIGQCLQAGCRTNKSRKTPRAHQLLIAPPNPP